MTSPDPRPLTPPWALDIRDKAIHSLSIAINPPEAPGGVIVFWHDEDGGHSFPIDLPSRCAFCNAEFRETGIEEIRSHVLVCPDHPMRAAERAPREGDLRDAERAADEVMAERDALMERLDEIAYAIAPESVIGEHSSANDPWANALAYLDGDYAEFPGIAAAKFALAERAPREGLREALREAVAQYDADMDIGGGYEDMVRASGPVWSAIRTLLGDGS